jgi:hypothetical protein
MPDNAKPARVYRQRRIRNSRLLNGGRLSETNGTGTKGTTRKRIRKVA